MGNDEWREETRQTHRVGYYCPVMTEETLVTMLRHYAMQNKFFREIKIMSDLTFMWNLKKLNPKAEF